MAEMYVNYGKFEEWAGIIDGKNTKLNDDLHEIQSTINKLAGEWESDSAVKIREKITGMESRFEQYYQVVDNYVKFLRNTAATYKTIEKTNTTNAEQFI